MPGPRKDAALVRLALSKLALNISFRPSASVTALIWRAIFKQCASDSTTFGPAIRKKGLAAFKLLKKSDSCSGKLVKLSCWSRSNKGHWFAICLYLQFSAITSASHTGVPIQTALQDQQDFTAMRNDSALLWLISRTPNRFLLRLLYEQAAGLCQTGMLINSTNFSNPASLFRGLPLRGLAS